jgi:hypothetical protein
MEVAAVRCGVVRRDWRGRPPEFVVAIVATSLVSGLRLAGESATTLAYLAAWVPLVAAVALRWPY